MLTLLNISNIALIDEIRIEFSAGLNLLTGETGSGKSIIVDALGLLIGGRTSAELIKQGAKQGFVEGLFELPVNPELAAAFGGAGIAYETRDGRGEIILRREIFGTGRSRAFINNQLATQTLLRAVSHFFADIHGQNEQQTLFEPATHLEMLDAFADLSELREELSALYRAWSSAENELAGLRADQEQKLQLADMLGFQIKELQSADLQPEEDKQLEEERHRLVNIEKLSALGSELSALLYDESASVVPQIAQVAKRAEELAQYQASFGEYLESIKTARAVLEDLSFAVRDFASQLEYSPARLAEIEDRLAELARLKRKYGGSLEAALEHLARAEDRLSGIEDADLREKELLAKMRAARDEYWRAARLAHARRVKAKEKFERAIEKELKSVALDKARLEVRIDAPDDALQSDDKAFKFATGRGFDRVEFYFSANVGEAVRPLARVASGGEASRLMLVLKTIASPTEFPRTVVFDEIDTGIGGRVAEAVGLKLKRLSRHNQVFCVTHQAQIARLADWHLSVEKSMDEARTNVNVRRLNQRERVDEIARMLTGAQITETAKRHAKELIKSAENLSADGCTKPAKNTKKS